MTDPSSPHTLMTALDLKTSEKYRKFCFKSFVTIKVWFLYSVKKNLSFFSNR